MGNRNRQQAPPGFDPATPQNPAEQMQRESVSKLQNLPQPYPPPPTINPFAAGQRRALPTMDEAPQGNAVPVVNAADHAGGEVPTTPAAAALAAARAAMEPVAPPGGYSPPPEPPLPPPPAEPPQPPSQAAAWPEAVSPLLTPPAAPAVIAPAKQNGHGPLPLSLLSTTTAPSLDLVAKPRYYAVLVPDDGHPELKKYDSLEELRSDLATRLEKDVTLFAFQGEWLAVSRGPERYLLVPGQPRDAYPLFKRMAPEEIEPDLTGWVGKESRELPIPLKQPDAPLDQNLLPGATAGAGTEDVPIFSS